MVKNKYILIFVIFMLLELACNESRISLSSSEYISYMNNKKSGFKKRITTSKIIYDIQTKTPEYIAIQEQAGLKWDDKLYEHRRSQLDSSIWFSVRIHTKEGNINPLKLNITNLAEYDYRLSYFLTEAKNHFMLHYGGALQVQIGYFFENNFGVSPFETMIIGYKLTDNLYNKDLEFVYDDLLFSNESIRIKIDKNELINRPQLSI